MNKQKFTISLFAIFLIETIAINYDEILIKNTNTSDLYYYDTVEKSKASRDNFIFSMDSLLTSLVPDTKLSAEKIITNCEKYEVDPIFVLAQAYIEGHFATKGLSAKTNSAFNVGAFDNKGTTFMGTYENPNDSIEPYLILLTNRYLINKTIQDLMINYVDIYGHRYASSSNYEQNLRSVYNKFYSKLEYRIIDYNTYYEI